MGTATTVGRAPRYLVQVRRHGQRGWKTVAWVRDAASAVREAQRQVDEVTWLRWRTWPFVRVMYGDELIAAWENGRLLTQARIGGAA